MKLLTALLINAKNLAKSILAYVTNDIVRKPTLNAKINGNTVYNGPTYSRFSDRYSYMDFPVKTPTTSMDLIIKAKTPNNYDNYSVLQSGREERAGIIFRFYDNYVRIWMSSTGNSWDICQDFRPVLNIPKNTKVWIRVKWDGSKYDFGYSLDGEEYIWGTSVTNSNPIYWDYNVQNLGGCYWETYPWINGTIDEVKCYIDNELYFDSSNNEIIPGHNTYSTIGSIIEENKIYNNFSSNSYISTSERFLPLNNEWEQVVKFKVTQLNLDNIIYSYGTRDQVGSLLYINSANKISLAVAINTGQWNIDTSSNYVINLDKWYYVKLYFTGTNYKVDVKAENDEDYQNIINIENNTPINSFPQKFNLGWRYYNRMYFRGHIDLNETYIKSGDEYFFNGSTAQKTTFGICGNVNYVPDKVYTNYSNSGYLILEDPFEPNNDSWEFNFKIKTGVDVYSAQHIFGAYDNASLLLSLSNDNFRIWLSTNGSNWNIIEGSYIGVVYPETIYYIKFGYDKEKFYFKTSFDGVNYNDVWSANSQNNMAKINKFLFGHAWYDSCIFDGQIYMDECSITKNGIVIWEGYKYPLKTGNIIKINEGLGYSNYKWNAFPEITKYQNEFTLESKIKRIQTDENGDLVYSIKEPKVPTNEVNINTGELYDCYSNSVNDVYTEHDNIICDNDYRITNINCTQGPGWTDFYSGKIISYLDKTYTTVNSFEIVWHFKTGSSIGDYERVFNWRGAGDYGDSTEGPYIQVNNGWVGLVFARGSYISIGAASAVPNTEYWVKWIYDGTDWFGYNSQDGITWNLYESSTPAYMPYFGRTDFDIGKRENGNDSGTRFRGLECLKDCYIKINGDMAWDGAKIPNPDESNFYTIKGTLNNNNGIISGFSSSDYITLPYNFVFNSSDSIEIVTDLNFNTTSSTEGFVFVNFNNTRNIQFYNSSTSDDFWYLNVNGQSAHGSKQFYSNIDYKIKVIITSSTISLYYYENDQWNLDISYNVNTSAPLSLVTFGDNYAHNSTRIFPGFINFNETYIKINNDIKFNGLTAIQTVKYEIVNSPKYLDNSNCYFGDASGKYLYINTSTNLHDANEWAIVTKVKYYSFRDDRIICNRIKDYVTPVLSFKNNKAHLWLSSNGTSWNITNNRESSRTLSTNIWYYIKLYFTGSAYKLDVSTTGEFNGEEVNYINYSNSNKVYSDNNSIISLLNNGWSTGYYSNAILDISESYITLDNNTYQLGEANVNSQFYEKVSDSELSPISINAKVNMDNNLIINNSIYSVDTSKDIVIPLNNDIIFTDSTDGNSEITLKISEDDYEFKSNTLLTEKRKYIDTSKYFSFDLEYLNGYNTKVIIEGKEYKPYELPCYVTKDMNIQIILNKTSNPTGSYIKSFWLNQSQFYKKQIVTIKSNLVADKISAIVNSTCLWQATNTDELIIEVYEGDHVDYKIEKTQYANIESFYDVPKLFANSNPVQEPEKTIDEEFIRVYRYEFDVDVNDAKIELSSSDTYQVGDNWIEVFEGADIYYTITKDSYETEEGVINNVTQDITRNINLNPIPVESVTAEIYPINITNVNCDIYKDTNDHYIASGRNSNSTLSNYTYLLNDPVIFPLDTAKSWEIQTTYRYLGGGDYQTILGSSKDDWHYGGLNFYTRENKFRLDFVNNKNSYYFNYYDKGDLGITPELGYSYKFKIGQIIEDNEWTANDGGGTKSTIYVDYIKSDRNTTENIELTTNGIVGGLNYACESCDNADTTFKCFNSTFDDEESEPTVTMSYESLTDIISQANPASITIYQSSTPMKFEKITFINSTTNPLTPKIGVVKGSNNESNWDDLAQIEIPNNNPGYKTEVNIMTGNTYKYIRCYFTESWVAQGISFQEIQLYRFSGAFAPTQLPTVQNPIWLTYYTPVAIRPTSFTLVNNKSLQNMKNGVIEGSTDNLNWDTLYTIENRAQCKGLSSNYKVTTNNKYNYFRLKITERYSDYKESYRDYYLVNNTQLQASINSDFFTKCLYGDINNGIANFEYKSIGWTLNNNSVNIANYLSIPSINTTSNIVENPTKVYTGFSSSDWINLPGTYLNLKTGYTWEIVIKVKFDSTSGTQNIISFGEEDNYGFLGYLDNGRLRLYAAIGGRNWNIGGDRGDYTYQTDTWYWIKWSYDGYYYYIEYSTDGQTWTTDLRVRNSGVLYSNNQIIYFGHRRSHTNEYLRGYIDINDTYIQVNSGKIFDGATLVNPTIGDKLDVYYSTRIESIPTTYTSLKRFIIDGFPFTYTGNYTRILNDIRNEKQYNIVNGDLVLNPNYIENKNPYVSVPLSFLGSSLESSSHYSLGSIDLTETKCYINNELYWEAIKTYNVNDEVTLNRGYGLFNNQWMITGQTKEYTGPLSKRAKIDSINDNQANVTPLYYTQNEIEIIPKDGNITLDADIVTSYELPTKNITINAINEFDGTGINDAIISVNTYSSDERNTCLVDNYREFHIEQIPGQVIEFYINSQKYILNDDNPVLIKRVQLYNTPKNDLSYYYYKIYENNVLLQDVPEQFLNDKNVIMLAHKFKINVTNETGCNIIYKIGDKVYSTIDGLVNCYSQQTIEYIISKQGYITETGSFTIPIECVTSRMYIINITLDESITLTVNSSENNSIINIECNGYEQVNNTITVREGNVVLEGDNLKEVKFINNGITITEEN